MVLISGCTQTEKKVENVKAITENDLQTYYNSGYKAGATAGVNEMSRQIEKFIKSECAKGGVIQIGKEKYYCGMVREF